MLWTMHEPRLMPPLTFPEWILMACVFFLLILAGWVFIKFAKIAVDMMKGE